MPGFSGQRFMQKLSKVNIWGFVWPRIRLVIGSVPDKSDDEAPMERDVWRIIVSCTLEALEMIPESAIYCLHSEVDFI